MWNIAALFAEDSFVSSILCEQYDRRKSTTNITKAMLLLNISKLFLISHLIVLDEDDTLNPGPMDSSDNATCARSEPFVFPNPKTRGLSMAHLNIRGIRFSLDEIKIFLGNKTPDVLALSETWLNEIIDDAELAVEGYVLIRKDRRYGNGGGVAAYIKSNRAFTERPELCCNNLEILWFEINIPKSKPVLIASVYRPPSTSDADMFFNYNFETLLQSIPIQEEYLILGDLNCDMTKNLSHKKSMLYRFELTQLIGHTHNDVI